MNYLKSFALVVVLTGLTSCSEPLPEGKTNYAGVWQGGPIFLEIKPNGNVSYAEVLPGETRTVDSPIKEFDGDSFVIGFLFFTERIQVDKPPYQEEGQWKMIVNGVELIKQEGL